MSWAEWHRDRESERPRAALYVFVLFTVLAVAFAISLLGYAVVTLSTFGKAYVGLCLAFAGYGLYRTFRAPYAPWNRRS